MGASKIRSLQKPKGGLIDPLYGNNVALFNRAGIPLGDTKVDQALCHARVPTP